MSPTSQLTSTTVPDGSNMKQPSDWLTAAALVAGGVLTLIWNAVLLWAVFRGASWAFS